MGLLGTASQILCLEDANKVPTNKNVFCHLLLSVITGKTPGIQFTTSVSEDRCGKGNIGAIWCHLVPIGATSVAELFFST